MRRCCTGPARRERQQHNDAAINQQSVRHLVRAGPHYCAAASPAGAPRLHGDSSMAAPSFGDAVKMGSTPVSNVTALREELEVPCMVTSITASPFCRSARATAGRRFSICCRSQPSRTRTRGLAGGLAGAGSSRRRIRTGRVRSRIRRQTLDPHCDTLCQHRRQLPELRMGATFMFTAFLVKTSITPIVLSPWLIAETVPAMLRNDPETISSALSSLPSALRVPRARSWSPDLISSSVPAWHPGT